MTRTVILPAEGRERSDRRYDVTCMSDRLPIVGPHFCRELTYDALGELRGCYGTDPGHGMTWEEARHEVARWHLDQAREWMRKPEPTQ